VKQLLLAAAQKAAAHAAHAAVAPLPSRAPLLPQLTPPPLPQQQPQSFFQQHAPWLTHGVAGIFIACAIGLIVLLAVQTTKQEGLSGTIGGRVESAYRGRLGAEEQLKRLTGWIAVLFVITAFILSLTGI
jgi:preprotein translocase subunit SecG